MIENIFIENRGAQFKNIEKQQQPSQQENPPAYIKN